jgi:hypothetical protein
MERRRTIPLLDDRHGVFTKEPEEDRVDGIGLAPDPRESMAGQETCPTQNGRSGELHHEEWQVRRAAPRNSATDPVVGQTSWSAMRWSKFSRRADGRSGELPHPEWQVRRPAPPRMAGQETCPTQNGRSGELHHPEWQIRRAAPPRMAGQETCPTRRCDAEGSPGPTHARRIDSIFFPFASSSISLSR